MSSTGSLPTAAIRPCCAATTAPNSPAKRWPTGPGNGSGSPSSHPASPGGTATSNPSKPGPIQGVPSRGVEELDRVLRQPTVVRADNVRPAGQELAPSLTAVRLLA